MRISFFPSSSIIRADTLREIKTHLVFLDFFFLFALLIHNFVTSLAFDQGGKYLFIVQAEDVRKNETDRKLDQKNTPFDNTRTRRQTRRSQGREKGERKKNCFHEVTNNKMAKLISRNTEMRRGYFKNRYVRKKLSRPKNCRQLFGAA